MPDREYDAVGYFLILVALLLIALLVGILIQVKYNLVYVL